ncbi:MAG: ATP-binding protein [Bryobacterales bacterium]|nr:ATP-binding protein [Bryobacterales bacterium]
MQQFARLHVRELCDLLAPSPRFMIAIFGPRQTGKTTIVRQALERVGIPGRLLSMDSLEPAPGLGTAAGGASMAIPAAGSREWLAQHWRAASAEAQRTGRGFVLALDEIQKLPNWSETVKGLWDAERAGNSPLRVVLLGSAPLLLQSGLHESLMGRFLPLPVTHWSYREMSDGFGYSLDEYLYFGGYPGPAHIRGNPKQWKGYMSESIVASAVDRDLLAMTRVDKPALLRRLVDAAFHCSGQIVSYNKLLGQLQDAGNATTLARYVDLLSSVGLVTGLSKYSGSQARSRASSPKLNVLNTALMAGRSAYTFEEARQDRTFWGRIVESAIGAHLVNTATPGIDVLYWRDGNAEVDFVLRGGQRLVGIEVKSGGTLTYTRGMHGFRNRHAVDNCIIAGGGGVPLDEFLSEPAEYWLKQA